MADLSNAMKAALLNLLIGRAAFALPGYVEVALGTAMVDAEAGTITELPVANGYARIRMDPAEWTVAADDGAGAYLVANTDAQTTAVSTGAWAAGAPITVAQLRTDDGRVLGAVAIPGAYQQAITGANQRIELPAGLLTFRMK